MADNKISDSAWTLLTSFHEANEAVVKHMVAAQERNRKIAENFFTEGMQILKANQKAVEDMVTAQERSVQHTQRFFTEGMEVLKANQAAAQSLQAAQERNESPGCCTDHYPREFQAGSADDRSDVANCQAAG